MSMCRFADRDVCCGGTSTKLAINPMRRAVIIARGKRRLSEWCSHTRSACGSGEAGFDVSTIGLSF